MKKILLLVSLAILLTACNLNDSELSLSEIKTLPNNVKELIEQAFTLQLINDREDIAYIVYQTEGTVTSDLEVKEGIVNVKLDVSTSENEDIKQHVYKLTVNPKHKVIEVYINGESITFDNISAL